MLPMVNRVALVVRPREPYAAWANAVDDEAEYDLAVHRNEPEVFLLPVWAADDLDAAIAEHWKAIFEQELEAWCTDDTAWPRKRTLAMFRDWFEVGLAEPVWDLATEELERDDP